MDESGTHPETPVLSVAGFYGTDTSWKTFREHWEPYSAEFHAKRSSRLFPQLCTAIEASEVNGVLVTIAKEQYKQNATPHLKTAVGNEYSACAFLCALEICKRTKESPVSIVLEQGQPNLAWVKRVLEDMITSGETCIVGVASAEKSEFIELHPADFVSHIASSHDVEWMQRLFNSKRLVQGHITDEMVTTTSPQVTALYAKARAMRRRAKKLGL